MLAARWRRPPRGSQDMSSTVGFKHKPHSSGLMFSEAESASRKNCQSITSAFEFKSVNVPLSCQKR
jgi:hypothetical protein